MLQCLGGVLFSGISGEDLPASAATQFSIPPGTRFIATGGSIFEMFFSLPRNVSHCCCCCMQEYHLLFIRRTPTFPPSVWRALLLVLRLSRSSRHEYSILWSWRKVVVWWRHRSHSLLSTIDPSDRLPQGIERAMQETFTILWDLYEMRWMIFFSSFLFLFDNFFSSSLLSDKQQCDDYFTVKHRGEMRGCSGIFFDNLCSPSKREAFNFIVALGRSFARLYAPFIDENREVPYTPVWWCRNRLIWLTGCN